MENFSNYTNTNVKFLREQKDIPQSKLAMDLNIDQSTLAKWENNTRQITLEWAIKLAEYFNIFIGDFISKDLRINEKTSQNKYSNKIKELETTTGVKVSYSSDKELTEEDYVAINQLVLNEMKNQNKIDNKEIDT